VTHEIAQMRNMSDTTKDPAEIITILPPSAFSGNDTAIGEGVTTSAKTTTPLSSPSCTDLRMNWGDACSLGCLPDLNWYLLLVNRVLCVFHTKNRASKLALLKQFNTLTGRKICYLRIDSAKEFH